jgi:hypothetical protein
VVHIIVLPIAIENNRLIIKFYVFNGLDVLLTKFIDRTLRIGPNLVDNSRGSPISPAPFFPLEMDRPFFDKPIQSPLDLATVDFRSNTVVNLADSRPGIALQIL